MAAVDRILVTFKVGAKKWKSSLEWVAQVKTTTLSQIVHDFALDGLRAYCKTLTLAQHIELISKVHSFTDRDLLIHLGIDEKQLADLGLGLISHIDLYTLAKLHPVLNAEELSYLLKD